MKRVLGAVLCLLLATNTWGQCVLRQSTAEVIVLGPFVDRNDGRSPETGLAANATRISKDGGAFAAGPVLGAHDENGNYSLALASGNTDTLGILLVEVINTTVHLPYKERCRVVTAVVYDALYAGTDNLDVNLALWLETAPLALVSQRPQVEVDVYDASIDFNATQKTSIESEAGDALATYDATVPGDFAFSGTAVQCDVQQWDAFTLAGLGMIENDVGDSRWTTQALEQAGGSGTTPAAVWAYDIPSNCAPSDTTACGVLDKLTEEAPTLATDIALGSVVGLIMDDGTAWSYNRATDSLEIISAASGLTAQQARDAMKLAPTGGAPAAGSVDEHLDDIQTDLDLYDTDAERRVAQDAAHVNYDAATGTEMATAQTDLDLYDTDAERRVAQDAALAAYDGPTHAELVTQTPDLLLDTTVASVIDQTNITVAANFAYDDQYNNTEMIIYDVNDNDEPCIYRRPRDTIAATNEIKFDIPSPPNKWDTSCPFTIEVGDRVVMLSYPGIWPWPGAGLSGPVLYTSGWGQTWPNYTSWNGRSISVPGGFDGILYGFTFEADSATTTTLTDSSLSWDVDEFYQEFWLVPLATPNMWKPRKVVSYDGATRTFTVDPPWDNAWGDLYYDIIIPSATEDPAVVWAYDIPSNCAPGDTTACGVLDKLTEEGATLSTDVDLNSIIGQILDNGGAWSYDRTLHSLEVVGGGGGGGGSPTVPQITAGLWDAVAASFDDAGSMGELQNNITGGTISVIQPVLDGGLIEITIGNDYLTVDGLQLPFSFSTPANLTAATGNFMVYAVNTSIPMLTQAVSIITPTGDPKRVDVDLTRVQTSTFVAPTQYRYVLDFTLASGSEVILVKGRLNAAD